MDGSLSGSILLVMRILMAISLYAFLGWAMYLLWSDLRNQAQLLAVRQPAPLTLTAKQGELVCHFRKPEVTIGRDPLSDCALDDSTVSAQHARLVYHHNQWWLEDLGSTNGTFLNQDPVSTPMVVTIGDQIRCGQVLITISIGEE